MDEVAPGVFRIPVPVPYPLEFVNCYLLKGKGYALIDTALDTNEAKSTLTGALAEMGLRLSDLDEVVITHHHPDHYGLSGLIEALGVAVRMLDVEYEKGHWYWTHFEAWKQVSLSMFESHGMDAEARVDLVGEMAATQALVHPPDHPTTFADGDRIEIAGMAFSVLWTPGHADGHAVFLREADGVLIAGDQLLERITPNIGLWAMGRSNPLQDFMESLKKVEALGARLALVGHYGPLIRDVNGRVRELLAHHQQRLERVIRILRPGPLNAWEVSWLLFPSSRLSLSQRRFAWAETLAHLEYLHHAGTVIRIAGKPIRYTL